MSSSPIHESPTAEDIAEILKDLSPETKESLCKALPRFKEELLSDLREAIDKEDWERMDEFLARAVYVKEMADVLCG